VVTGYVLSVAGLEVGAVAVDMGPLEVDGKPGRKWCAQSSTTGTYDWTVAALWEEGEVPASNGPQTRYRSMGCRLDVNADGAVGLSDVSTTLAYLGEVCLTDPP
jgi:hypothetical protein